MFEHARSLAVFATVAECGSFRGAAKRLGLSPAAVSGHVSQLEERFGVALMYRSTRKLTLTDIGRQIAAEGRAVLDASQAALDLVEAQARAPAGSLNISAPTWLQNGRFVEDVAEFATKFQDIKISLTFSDLRPDVIGEGLDLALTVGPVEDSSLKCRRLIDVHELLVASPTYLRNMPELHTPSDLKNHWFVGFPAMQTTPMFIAKTAQVESYQNPVLRSRFSVETRHFAYQFALRGIGLAVLPDLIVSEHIAAGDLVELLPQWYLQPKELLAIWPSNAGKWSPAISMSKHIIAKLHSYAEFDELTRKRL